MRDLLGAGFRDLGYAVSLRAESDGFARSADWHVVMVPDEFFTLDGAPRADRALPQRLIVVNTEQRASPWFLRAAPVFKRALVVWDIDYENTLYLNEAGVFADFLALGYAEEIECRKRRFVPPPRGLGIDPALWNEAEAGAELWTRPLDVFFVGRPTPRRMEFFSENGACLARWKCFFFFSDALSPRHGRGVRHDHIVTLARRSKIILNLHGDEHDYFEWHRIVQLGIAHRSLVLSEPCGFNPYFAPGKHYLEESLHRFGDRLAALLGSTAGRKEAECVAAAAWDTLIRDCRMADMLRPLMERASHVALALQ
jgi:hypothetical protein